MPCCLAVYQEQDLSTSNNAQFFCHARNPESNVGVNSRRGDDLRTPPSTRVAVVGRNEQGGFCTLAVERVGSNFGLLRYDGSGSAVAELTSEVIERLFVALSVRGRTAIPARCPGGGACTLLIIGQRGGTRVYLHAAIAFGAVLDRDTVDQLRAGLEQLRGGPGPTMRDAVTTAAHQTREPLHTHEELCRMP